MRYNPSVASDPIAWIDSDEQERIDAVQIYHRRAKDQADNPKLHAIMHAIVETQLVNGIESTRSALERLLREGLDRHDAIHAIGSIVAEGIFEVLRSRRPHDPAAFAQKLDALSAASWRQTDF